MMKENHYFEYVHRDLGQEVTAVGGHYRFTGRHVFPSGGDRCFTSLAMRFLTAPAAGWGAVVTPSFRVLSKTGSTEAMRRVSSSPAWRKLMNQDTREKLGRLIQAKEKVQQVVFRTWS